MNVFQKVVYPGVGTTVSHMGITRKGIPDIQSITPPVDALPSQDIVTKGERRVEVGER